MAFTESACPRSVDTHDPLMEGGGEYSEAYHWVMRRHIPGSVPDLSTVVHPSRG